MGQRNDRPQQDEVSKLPRVEVGGRFITKFNPDLALEIVERIANGETLNAICRNKPGMPHPTTFRRWAVNNPDLAKAYTQAIIISASSLEEEALDEVRKMAAAPRDGTHVRAVEVRVNQLRWSAERRDPARYGSKSQVNIRVPIQINTSLDLGQEAGAAGEGGIYTIEAKQQESLSGASERASDMPLVEERRIPLGNQGKKKLIPPSGIKDNTPYQKAARGIVDESKVEYFRPEGDKRSGRQEPSIRPRQALPPSLAQATHDTKGDEEAAADEALDGVGEGVT